MVKLAVIGKDVSQSVSPNIHNFIASRLNREITYDKISIPEGEFDSRIEQLLREYDGMNVTIPYKLSIIPYLESVQGDALTFGAVNTVISATRTGYNTDGMGFMQMLAAENVDVAGERVLLLGAGGAGRSVAKKLKDGGAEVYLYDKNTENAKKVAEEFAGINLLSEVTPAEYGVIVNATGVGMHKSVGISPVPEEVIKGCKTAVDLIYVPEKSEFLRIAEANGKKIINGSAMLFYQAYYSDCYYFDIQPDPALAAKLFSEFLKVEL